MAVLTQTEDQEKIYFAWYGSCQSEPCSPFSLAEYKDVFKNITELNDTGVGSRAWQSHLSDMFQPFTSLNCGHAYRIVLKTGTDSVDINGLIVAGTDANTNYGMLTNSCYSGVTPTPSPQKTPTPTPASTPTPTPERTPTPVRTPTPLLNGCCDGMDYSVEVIQGGPAGDNNVTISTQGKNTDNTTWDGIMCWEELTEDSGGDASYQIELRTSASEDPEYHVGLIVIKTTAKIENQKFVYKINSSGLCFTGELKSTSVLGTTPNVWLPVRG